jgi:hypothetical protein
LRRQGYVLTAAISAVTLIAVGAAFGAGGVSIVKHTDTGVLGGPSSRAADCASNDHVLGGGFQTATDNNLGQVDRPSGDGSWATETLTSGGDASAYAVCERASNRKLDLVKHSTLVAQPSTSPGVVEKGVKAKCDKGWQVVSGGYEVNPFFHGGDRGEIAVDTNKRTSSRVWKVHGGNDGKPTRLVAYAICEKKGESTIQQVGRSDSTGNVESAKAICPKGSHVVGGGFRSVPNEAHGNFPNVNSSFPASGRTWKTQQVVGPPMKHGVLHNLATLTSYAECEKG